MIPFCNAQAECDKIFGTLVFSKWVCNNCDRQIATNSRDSRMLLLPVAPSLVEALRNPFMDHETRRQECQDCPTAQVSNERGFWTAPKVLCIVIGRNQGRDGKDVSRVEFDEHLDFETTSPDGSSEQTFEFRLLGIIVHRGTESDHGHYVAYTRRDTQGPPRHCRWYRASDSRCAEVTLKEVLSQIVSIFFYELVEVGGSCMSDLPAPAWSGTRLAGPLTICARRADAFACRRLSRGTASLVAPAGSIALLQGCKAETIHSLKPLCKLQTREGAKVRRPRKGI